MPTKPHILIFLIGLTFSSTVTRAQEVNELLTRYFTEVRSGQYPIIPREFSLPENSKKTLEGIVPYLADTLASIRSKAYTITNIAGTNAKSADIRQNAVLKLTTGAGDNDAGIAGGALDYLTNFLRQDFNAATKDSIRNLFKRKTSHLNKVIRLAGFLELKDLVDELRALAQPGNPQQIRWASLLALARMSDNDAIQNMMARVRKLPINDDVVYEIFPDLVYTRSREAIDYLVEVMASDAKNCLSADAEREVAIPCGYRIMEQLAPVIKDYPLALDESGEIQSNDYPASLAAVRKWFSQHGNYEIFKDRF